MQLGTMDSTPIYKVDHRIARFVSATTQRPSASLQGRVVALHYGRKKFTQVAGKWQLDCVSSDARMGTTAELDSIVCLSSLWHCADCKSILSLAIVTAKGPVILEASASVAVTIRDRLAPVVARGVALDSFITSIHLGLSQSSRMTFAQASVDLYTTLASLAEVPRPSHAALAPVLSDFDDHIARSFSIRAPRTPQSDLSSAELIV